MVSLALHTDFARLPNDAKGDLLGRGTRRVQVAKLKRVYPTGLGSERVASIILGLSIINFSVWSS